MKIFEAVKSALLKGLPDLAKRDLYYRVYDVHYYLYRRADHFVIWSDANMMVYIIGGELLQKIYGDRARRLSGDELIVLAHRWFEKNPDGLIDIWENTLLGLPEGTPELASL